MGEWVQTYRVTYACPNHGFGVKAIDRTWCVECVVESDQWVKVEHVAELVGEREEP